MASNVAPPNNTGGFGFVFEDEVCAWLLASMLVGDAVFGVEYGPPVRINFQTRVDGWFLDDVLVITSPGGIHHSFALSVKSNAQFTATSAPPDFVANAWEQLLHVGSSTFDESVDFMGIVTRPLSGAAKRSLGALGKKVRTNDPMLLPSRLATPNWANTNEKRLFESFACPVSLGDLTSGADTARLLKRLHFIQHDFGDDISDSHNRALDLCRRAIRSQTISDAQALWSILRELASSLRPQAGSLTLVDLIDRLRCRVSLAEYPNHSRDWRNLDARSSREAGLVRASISDRIHLRRDEHVAGVIRSIQSNAQVALLGASGIGKSALAKAAFEQRASSGQRSLWIDTSSFDRAADFGTFEASLQLQHSVVDLLGMEVSQDPVIILDGIDRLYTDVSFRTVATLLKSTSTGSQATKWHVMAVCQTAEWPRVLESLQRAGAPVTPWVVHEVEGLQPEALLPVSDSVPSLARLLLQPRVGPLLTNLKLLDLVVRRLDGGTHIDASDWVGESSVAEWFWTGEVDRGPDRLVRGQFVRALAQAQADQLAPSVAVDSLDASLLCAAQSLIADKVLVVVHGDRIAFAHDLYGDWARLRVLLNHKETLGTFLQTRHESPLWHRALRLFGIYILEREHGIAKWRKLMASFNASSQIVVRDLLLEAPAFAMNAEQLLETIFPDLISGDGELLRRLLTRFLAFATVPDERTEKFARAVGMDANEARAAYRRPHLPYWFDILAVLYTNRGEALRVAVSEVTKVVTMWLEFTQPGFARRSEAAELAVLLGQKAVDSRDDYLDQDQRESLYKCALMAAPEQPDEVTLLARTAAERIPRPVVLAGEPIAPWPQPRGSLKTRHIRGPWPDGPLIRIDEAFQNVVLDTTAIKYLFCERPEIAREVILATLIAAPRTKYRRGCNYYERDLDIVTRYAWSPALYNRGPFLMCLTQNFTEGLELVMRLVDFATARVGEQVEQEQIDLRSRVHADGHDEAELDLAMAAASARGVSLLDKNSNVLRFEGDELIYGWSSGLGNAPVAVESALMALEQYFYSRLDNGDDISDEISVVLARTRSVAVLGVLCDIGKHKQSLFDGPLRPLLSGPELYSWQISSLTHSRASLIIGARMNGRVFLELAKHFHGLRHRKHDLRIIAAYCLIHSNKMQGFFAHIREWWICRKANGEYLHEMTEQLTQLLNPSGYELREDPKLGSVLVNFMLEQDQNKRVAEIQAIQDRMLVRDFPSRCRSILHAEQALSDTELEEIWQEWVHIRDLAEVDQAAPGDDKHFADKYLDPITGGIAVFLWQDGWASRDSTKQQEIETTLKSIINEDILNWDTFTSKRDTLAWTWDCFIAEAAAILWARQPQDAKWRQLVAKMVHAENYQAIRLLYTRCAKFRTTLGADFERLRRLALDWAHMRDRVDFLRRPNHLVLELDEKCRDNLRGKLARLAEESLASFVDESLDPHAHNWSESDNTESFVEIDDLRRRSQEYRTIDFHLVRCSHEWMPQLVEAQSPDERASILQFWRVALDFVVKRPSSGLQESIHPDEDEWWVLENIAGVVLQLSSSESPDPLWMAIIDLRSEAHDWPEKFLTALHCKALAEEVLPTTYASLVRRIAEHTFSDDERLHRWPSHEEVWDALLGINSFVADLWSSRHHEHVRSIWDVYSLWMDKAPQDSKRLATFAHWLSREAGAPIRLCVLAWFFSQLQLITARPSNRGGYLANKVAKLLNAIWDEDLPLLRADSEALTAFHGLLGWLVECQNSLGLELQGRIGGLS